MIRPPPRSSLFSYPTLFFFFFNDTATTEIYTLSLHDALPISLILFVVFMGHNVKTRDLEKALYGATVNELSSIGGLTIDCHEEGRRHGVFCPPGPRARHRELSAVIGCNWFDTLARGKPGRRLCCGVYHHWQPRVAVALGSFGRFQDVYWLRNESGLFIPVISGEPNLVMTTTSETQPDGTSYSADTPW